MSHESPLMRQKAEETLSRLTYAHLRWVADYDMDERLMGLGADVEELHELCDEGVLNDEGALTRLGHLVLKLWEKS